MKDPIANPILAAYIQGINEKEASAKAAKDQQQEDTRIKIAQQVADQQKQEHLDLIDRTTKQFDAEQARAKAEHAVKVQEIINKVTDTHNAGGGDSGGIKTDKGVEYPDLGITLNLEDPTAVATRKANVSRIEEAPKFENKKALDEANAKSKSDIAEANNRGREAVLLAGKNADLSRQREKLAADFDREMQVQAAKNKGSLAVAEVNAQAGLDKLNNKQATLSAADKAKIDALNDIESELGQALPILEKGGYDFFQGPYEGLKTRASIALPGALGGTEGQEPTQEWSQIKNHLGAARQAFATAVGGKSFTPTEEKLIDTFLVAGEHTYSAQEAKTSLDNLNKRIQAMKGSVYSKYSGAQPKDNTPVPPVTPKPNAAVKAPPKVGDVVNGYTYKGGDPNKQESWKK